ncbi:MAG: hypothetical protein WKG07_49670 [Hymenobacter sp.]
MKTSMKLLLAAALVLLASLTAYNMALRAEYRSGTYKDPLHDYTTLSFRNFTEVEALAAGVVGIRVVAGPYQVRISPQAAKYVRLRQQGSRLVITAAFPNQRESPGQATVLISCPQLNRLTANAEYAIDGQPHRDKQEISYAARPVVVQGFAQDSLSVRQDNASRIELTDNRLGFLRAVAGLTPGNHAGLTLAENNRIAAASLTIGHQSELTINDVEIPKLRYRFGDSAKVTLTGRALRGGVPGFLVPGWEVRPCEQREAIAPE